MTKNSNTKYETTYRLFVEDPTADEPTLVMVREYSETERARAVEACKKYMDRYARVEKTTYKYWDSTRYSVENSEVIKEN